MVGRREDIARVLFEHGANIADEALYTAVVIHNQSIVRALLERSTSIDLETSYEAVH